MLHGYAYWAHDGTKKWARLIWRAAANRMFPYVDTFSLWLRWANACTLRNSSKFFAASKAKRVNAKGARVNEKQRQFHVLSSIKIIINLLIYSWIPLFVVCLILLCYNEIDKFSGEINEIFLIFTTEMSAHNDKWENQQTFSCRPRVSAFIDTKWWAEKSSKILNEISL